MNRLFITAALVATSFSALANGEATYEYPQPITSNVSRAEVQAQTALAAARGEIVSGELSYVAPAHGAALSRAEVRLTLDEARRNGELVSGELSFVAEAPATEFTRMANR
ncbi:MAG: DUF4148 domain-containing protein [Burkholderiaceae bacterium]|nr:DUF4148 domain-containing protein [Burkholderiaceae bacterium]